MYRKVIVSFAPLNEGVIKKVFIPGATGFLGYGRVYGRIFGRT
jgi:hypothetical protein